MVVLYRDAPEATGDEPEDTDFDMPKIYEPVGILILEYCWSWLAAAALIVIMPSSVGTLSCLCLRLQRYLRRVHLHSILIFELCHLLPLLRYSLGLIICNWLDKHFFFFTKKPSSFTRHQNHRTCIQLVVLCAIAERHTTVSI